MTLNEFITANTLTMTVEWTVRNPDGTITVPVQYKVEEMLHLASRNVGTEWHDYCLNAAISWASR